jgi:glycosyltransferase involved in cell wall biosynthesis
VFVGRLSSEKGIDVLLRAWQRPPAGLRLKVIGDGPLLDLVREASFQSDAIECLGQQPFARVLDLIANAACLLQPSICYENFPRTIVEAFALGTPVIASRLGAMAEIVRDGQTGLLFEPNDPADLARQVERFAAWPDPGELRRAARAEYLAHYTPERNYQQLMAIYEQAIAARRAGGDVEAPSTETPPTRAPLESRGEALAQAAAISSSESRSCT